MVLVCKINRTFPWVFAGKNDGRLPCRAAILRPGDNKTGSVRPSVADCPANALIQKKQFREFAHEFAAEAIHFHRYLAWINWLPLPTAILSSHDARAASHKTYLSGSEAIVAPVLGDGSDILPVLS